MSLNFNLFGTILTELDLFEYRFLNAYYKIKLLKYWGIKITSLIGVLILWKLG